MPASSAFAPTSSRRRAAYSTEVGKAVREKFGKSLGGAIDRVWVLGPDEADGFNRLCSGSGCREDKLVVVQLASGRITEVEMQEFTDSADGNATLTRRDFRRVETAAVKVPRGPSKAPVDDEETRNMAVAAEKKLGLKIKRVWVLGGSKVRKLSNGYHRMTESALAELDGGDMVRFEALDRFRFTKDETGDRTIETWDFTRPVPAKSN